MDDNHEIFMADMIASGTIATFTKEECSQADMYLNIPPNEDTATPVMDTTTNIVDDSRNNEESVVNESIESSHEESLWVTRMVELDQDRTGQRIWGSSRQWVSAIYIVDVKSAPHAKHTTSRTKLA
jgi:hypothetical protein